MAAIATHPTRQSNPSRGLPNWASALILLLVLMLGGWGLWKYYQGGSGNLPPSAADSLTDANVVGPNIPRQPRQWQGQGPGQRQPNNGNNFGQFLARFGNNMPDGIVPAGNAYLVKSGNVRLNIDLPNGNNRRGDWRYRFSYAQPIVPPADQETTILLARKATADPAAAQKLGVTADQLQQLRALPGNAAAMVVSQPERAQISTLFHAWLTAAGRSANSPPLAATRPSDLPTPQSKAAEQALVSALADIGKNQLDATRKGYADRASRIQAILGDAILQKLKTGG